MSLISTLPGATEFKSDHYSGYLRVSDTKRIFFYFVESENHPLQDSTIFLINGGPGCSGLLAAFIQNGPWKIMSDGSLLNNEYSWSTRSNVVYLDLPVNTGFSFSTSSDADRVYNDDVSSDESLASITAFFKIFPDLTNNPFFVASEGYGGHFAPQVALKILEQEDTVITTHFAGIIVGNPLVNFKANLIAQAETRWGFQLISKRVWDAHKGCMSKNSGSIKECRSTFDEIMSQSKQVNSEAVMEELCESKNLQEIEEFANKAHKNNLSSVHEQVWDSFLQRINAPVEESVSKTSVDLLNTHIDIFDRTDMIATPVSIRRFRLLNTLRRLWVAPSATTYSHNPCTETYLTSYLNRRDVQQAMNVIRKGSSLSVSFSPCNSQIMSLYSVNDMQADVTKLYSQIVKHGNKPEGFSILILSGDTDLTIPTIGTQKWIDTVAGADSSQPKSLWVPWADKNSQPSGFISEFSNNLTFVTIRGAGYQIGQFQPQRLHLIFSSFVTSTNNRSNGVKVDSALLTALIATAGTFLFLIVIVVGVFINYSKSATVKARAREVVDGSAGVEDTDENNNQNRCSGINLTSIRSSTVSIDEK